MTREEAIEQLRNLSQANFYPSTIMALDMAIEALQDLSKPNNRSQGSDLIRRQDAIEAVATVTMSIHLSNVLCDKLLALPSADAVQIPIKLEKRYPQSRDEDITDAFMRGYLAGRSSADRPTGEWVNENGKPATGLYSAYCSNCGYCSFGKRRECDDKNTAEDKDL